jgi:hypothetical protein
MHTHSPNKPKKFKQTLSARKLMATVFWDRRGVLMVKLMQQETTMSIAYCEKLKNCTVIQNKRHGTPTFGVVLLHDVRPHTAAHTHSTNGAFQIRVWPLSLQPSSCSECYHLFTYLKNWLQSQHFTNNEEFMEGAKTWLSSQKAAFFDTGIQDLFLSNDKYLNSGSDYVEK